MIIKMQEIPIRDVVEKYKDNANEGVIGYDNRLNIRPAYQREFVYKDAQRDAVIDTVRKGFPLNVMYWVKNADGTFEVLDGQQRTISICQYVHGDFSIDFRYFFNLTKAEQDQILDYKLMVYVCEGSDKEKLEWFKIINIAGERLYEQELRNAVYTGPWLTDAKRHFSKNGCAGYHLGKDYMSGNMIRQDYLETALRWIAHRDGLDEIADYMSKHQLDADASDLWVYFQTVMNWVKVLFPTWRKEMKNVEWGLYYNDYHKNTYNPNDLEKRVKELIMDDDVTKKSGIYEYLIDGKEKHLSVRAFTPAQKQAAYERQNGICPICKEYFDIKDMEGDHITPWSKGGHTTADNCQMLCKDCNRHKSDT